MFVAKAIEADEVVLYILQLNWQTSLQISGAKVSTTPPPMSRSLTQLPSDISIVVSQQIAS